MIDLIFGTQRKIKTTLVISDGHILSKNGEILSKEITRIRILVKINDLKNSRRKVTWQVLAVENDFFNAKDKDVDDFDKSLLGVSIRFKTNIIGNKVKIGKLKKVEEKIEENLEHLIEENPNIGMNPREEQETEYFLKKSFQDLYKYELKNYIKKFHRRYGIQLPLEKEIKRGSSLI